MDPTPPPPVPPFALAWLLPDGRYAHRTPVPDVWLLVDQFGRTCVVQGVLADEAAPVGPAPDHQAAQLVRELQALRGLVQDLHARTLGRIVGAEYGPDAERMRDEWRRRLDEITERLDTIAGAPRRRRSAGDPAPPVDHAATAAQAEAALGRVLNAPGLVNMRQVELLKESIIEHKRAADEQPGRCDG